MSSIANVLELSLGSAIDPQMEAERRANIEALQEPMRRRGALALHNLAIHHPDVAIRLFNATLKSRGLVYLGGGVEASAYLSEDTVIKIKHSSVLLDEAERRAAVDTKTQEFNQLERHLGAYVVTQQILVDEHPFGAPSRAVQTIQPYVDFQPLEVVMTNQRTVDHRSIELAESRHPGITSALVDFVAATDRYYEQTGYLPDINGRDNLVVADISGVTELVLVDSQPIPPSVACTQELIASQLASLDQVLSRVA